MIEKTQIFQLV